MGTARSVVFSGVRRALSLPPAPRLLIAGALWIGVAIVLADVVTSPATQADLRIYSRAALEFEHGENPYTETRGPFVYPPLTLHVFRPLTWLAPATAETLWLGLKLAALAGFLWVCHTSFVYLSPLAPVTLLFFGIGYNQAILRDLRSGNVAMFETALVLAALAQLVAARPGRFAALLLAAGQFKIAPLALLAAPAVVRADGWRRATAFGAAAAACLLFANAALYPDYWADFLRGAASMDERGDLNPSSFAFVSDQIARATGQAGAGLQRAAVAAYLLWSTAVLAISARSVLRYHRSTGDPDRSALALFACVVYGLVLPRFKDYSYVLLLVPALDIARRRYARGQIPYPLVFVFFSVLGYGPLFGNVLVWFAYLHELGRSRLQAVDAPAHLARERQGRA